jgi:hypothetical protein
VAVVWAVYDFSHTPETLQAALCTATHGLPLTCTGSSFGACGAEPCPLRQSLEKEMSASRLAAASVQAMQHRMVRQLEVVTAQLDLSNKQRASLQAEVDQLRAALEAA